MTVPSHVSHIEDQIMLPLKQAKNAKIIAFLYFKVIRENRFCFIFNKKKKRP